MKWPAIALATQAAVLAVLLGVSLDIYAHKRVEGVGGVNIWGYRGPVARQKRPNEIRLVMIGGTRAFGWGQPASGTTVSELRRLIMLRTDRPGAALRPVVAINLARAYAVPGSYQPTIDHYGYLAPDFVCIYDDLGVPAGPASDAKSGVFALTGYEPALPLVLREKGMVWRFGDVHRGYTSAALPVTSAEPWIRRTAGLALQTAGAALDTVDHAVGRAIAAPARLPAESWGPDDYADAMVAAADTAHAYARGVVIVVSPAETPEQGRNLAALARELRPRLATSSWLRFVDLTQTPELADPALRIDEWNYGAAGIAIAARAIVPALLELVEAR